jgi:hypothetical protein
MALTRANKEPNSVLLTPYITIDGQLIQLGSSGSLSSIFLKDKGNTTYLNLGTTTAGSDNGSIELNANLTSNGYTYIDFHTSFPAIDYDARIIKNPGSTGSLDIIAGNTGQISNLTLSSTGGSIILNTALNQRLSLDNLGNISLSGQTLESATVSATSANTTVTYDVITNKNILYYTSNAGANWTFNVRGSSTVSLNTLMTTGQSLTVVFLNTNGATAYYPTAFQIDGSAITPKWQGGTAPASGNVNSIDSYSYTIVKTGSAAYTVFASQTRFA